MATLTKSVDSGMAFRWETLQICLKNDLHNKYVYSEPNILKIYIMGLHTLQKTKVLLVWRGPLHNNFTHGSLYYNHLLE